MQRISIFILLISLYSCHSPTQNPTRKQLSLENTQWNSQFYQYNNFYHFTDASSGYSQDGQVAWSVPIDLKARKIPKNKILYNDKEAFTYAIKDSKLTIHYLNQDTTQTPLDDRVFNYRKKHADWISVHVYTYGSEVLKPGKRNAFYEDVPAIK